MPVQSRLPPSAIAHLRLCGKCETGRLTPPVLCKGTKKLSDRDRWYELVSVLTIWLAYAHQRPPSVSTKSWTRPSNATISTGAMTYLAAPLLEAAPSYAVLVTSVRIYQIHVPSMSHACWVYASNVARTPICPCSTCPGATSPRMTMLRPTEVSPWYCLRRGRSITHCIFSAPLEGRVHWRDAPGEPPSIDSADSPTPPADTRHTTRASSARQPDTRNGSPVTQASSATRGRRAASQPSRSARAAARTNAPAPTSTPTPPTLSQPPRVAPDRSEPASSSEPSGGHVSRRKSQFGISISPNYDLCLDQADDLDRARSQQMTAHAAVQQAQTRTFYLKWWHKVSTAGKYLALSLTFSS